MAASARRGQILGELLWSILLVVSFATFLFRLHSAAKTEQNKPRWELERGYRR